MGQMSSQRIRYLRTSDGIQLAWVEAGAGHVSNLFDKLGVWTRAQAIVYARDCGFAGAGQLPTPNSATPKS